MSFEHMNGWLVLYISASMTVFAFWSAGLAGWFFDYPLPLFLAIMMMLVAPLVMLLLGIPNAHIWNVAGLIAGATLLVARVAWGWAFAEPQRLTLESMTVLLVAGLFAIVWSAVWAIYLLRSTQVARAFG